jgi:leader peptidase (prepilin peptidase)/N-methyltransferase
VIEGLVVAVAVGLLTAAGAGPVLRWLPEPTEADKVPYRDLATIGFRVTCGLLAASATAISGLILSGPVEPLWWVLGSAGLLLVAIDARTTWLPLRLTQATWVLMAVATIGTAAWAGSWSLLLHATAGAIAAGLLYFGVWWVSRGGFGFGDVRFAPLLGAASAAQSLTLLLWALVLGTLVGGVHGLVRLIRRRRDGFAYAPAMLAGAYLACIARALIG